MKNQKYINIKFEEDEKRVIEFKNWSEDRIKWCKSEILSRECDDLYNELFSLYSTLKKDSESLELVFGDGNLIYKDLKYGYINHPIILQSIKLEFNASVPKFSLVIGEKESELYKSIFNSVPGANHEILRDLYKEFDDDLVAPNDLSKSKSFLNRLAHALSPSSQFVDNFKDIKNEYEYPQIYMKPILFLRKRNLGFGVAIESIIEDLNSNYNPPSFLEEVVGVESNYKGNAQNDNSMKNSSLYTNGIDQNILLTKPANAEQLTVAKQLERHGAVLVQGRSWYRKNPYNCKYGRSFTIAR